MYRTPSRISARAPHVAALPVPASWGSKPSSALYEEFRYGDLAGADFWGGPCKLSNFVPFKQNTDQRLGQKMTDLSRKLAIGLGRSGDCGLALQALASSRHAMRMKQCVRVNGGFRSLHLRACPPVRPPAYRTPSARDKHCNSRPERGTGGNRQGRRCLSR